MQHDMEGRNERHYPCLTLNFYIYWTINKPEQTGQVIVEDRQRISEDSASNSEVTQVEKRSVKEKTFTFNSSKTFRKSES